MNRFAAILWNHRSDKAVADAGKLLSAVEGKEMWRSVWQRPGVAIFEAGAQSGADLRLEVGSCYFVGAVFTQHGSRASEDTIDAEEARRTGAASLFSAVWGRYVAFVLDEPEACVYVARDPSGALPCFVGKRGWAFVFFSHPDDIVLFDIDRKWIDWSYVSQRLVNNRAQSRRTGLDGVAVLPPGAVARIGQGRLATEQKWRPADTALEASRASLEQTAEPLRQAVELCCRAWAQCFDRVGLRLSGGLDSSIVLAAIAPYTHVEALNFATPNAEGDERDYARKAAAFGGAHLTEYSRDPENVDLEAAVLAPPTLNPPLWIADVETDVVESQFARERGVSAIFSGRGGDNVFFRSEQPHVLADWLVSQGIGIEFLQRAWNYASASGEPFASAVMKAFRMRSGASPAASATPAFLSKKAIDRALKAEEGEPPPWLPAGKALHVRTIEDRLNYFDYRPHADYIYPLVSQPVIEACLRLPTFLLSPSGNDRALARQAFADRIAPAILARQSKGRTNAYLARILIRHVSFLRRYLLEGELAGAGLLDCDALSAALSEGALVRSMDAMANIVGLLGVEAWLRRPPLPSPAASQETASAS